MITDEMAAKFGTTKKLVQERHDAVMMEDYPELDVPTDRIREFAKRIEGTNADSIIRLMQEARKTLKDELVDESTAKSLYLRRSADEILKSGKKVCHAPNPRKGMPDLRIGGCQDTCILALALLKAKGIPQKEGNEVHYVRTNNNPSIGLPTNHAIILAKMGKEHLILDLCNQKFIRQITPKLYNRYLQSNTNGKNAFAIGIKNVYDAFDQAED